MNGKQSGWAELLPPDPGTGLAERRLGHEVRSEARVRDLLVLAAGAGYGKTALLSALARTEERAAWLSVRPGDRDPDRFLAGLTETLARTLGRSSQAPGRPPAPGAGLERGRQGVRAAAVRLINWLADALPGPTLLIIDDYHQINDVAPLQEFMLLLLEYLPADLHLALGTRSLPDWPLFARWQASGRAVVFGQDHLRFQRDETAALLARHGIRPGAAMLDRLLAATEGWAMGISLLGQVLREHPGADGTDTVLAPLLQGPAWSRLARDRLFAYLSGVVLQGQSPAVRRFLVEAAVLDTMTPEACDAVLNRDDSAALLPRLQRQGLFLTRSGAHAWRFHNLFHGLLRQELAADPDRHLALRRAAGRYFEGAGSPEEAIPHWLAAGEWERAARCVGLAAAAMVREGRHATLAGWLDRFTADQLERHPDLLYWRGHSLEIAGQWEEALGWYERADRRYREAGQRAGQLAVCRRRVHIATWWERKPRKAGHYAQLALTLLEQGAQPNEGDRYKHLALAHMTPGNLDRARQFCRRAVDAYRAAGNLEAAARTLLHPGGWIEFMCGDFESALARADEAARLLGPQASLPFEAERLTGTAGSYVLLYRFEESRTDAQRALVLAEQLAAHPLRAMNHRTLGMAWQVGAGADLDLAHYHVEQALRLATAIQDAHVLVSAAYVKLRLAHRLGEKAVAEALVQCRSHVERYGEHWLAGHALANMGLVLMDRDPPAARGLLVRSLQIARHTGDGYGQALARVGLALVDRHDPGQLQQHLAEALQGLDRYGSGLLLGDFGAELAQLRAAALRAGWPAAALTQLAPSPRAAMEIRALGGFAVTVAGQPVAESAWGGTRARDLLKFLVVRHPCPVPKPVALRTLWGHLSAAAAENNLYKTLHQLRRALDASGELPRDRFVIMQAGLLSLAPDVWVDVTAFAQRVAEAQKSLAEGRDGSSAYRALLDAEQLWAGDFLPADPYTDWLMARRQELQEQRCWVLEQLADAAAASGDYPGATLYLKRILHTDFTREGAHRRLIECLYRSGRLWEARRQYRRCRRILQRELGVEPTAETIALARRLFGAAELSWSMS